MLSFFFNVAHAQYAGPLAPITNVNGLILRIVQIGNWVIYLLTAFAVVYIVWYVVIYFVKGDGEESRAKAGMNILWGIVGLAIIVSIWGLVNILLNTFGTNNQIPVDRFPNTNFINTTVQTTP